MIISSRVRVRVLKHKFDAFFQTCFQSLFMWEIAEKTRKGEGEGKESEYGRGLP